MSNFHDGRIMTGRCVAAYLNYCRMAASGLIAVACLGCGEDLTIRQYQVAKDESQLNQATSVASAAAQDQQMLGVIVPHSRSAWFFKMQGTPELIVKNRDEFLQMVTSVHFQSSGEPKWVMAEGWNDQVLGGGITYAKWLNNEDGLTATVTMLATASTDDAENWQGYVLENVNRWRGQLELSQKSWEATRDELEEVPELSQGPAKAYFVSLIGKSRPGGFRPPFMRGAMTGGSETGGAVPGGTNASPEGSIAGSTRQQLDSPASEASEDTTVAGSQPSLDFVTPEGWEALDVSQQRMRLAAFQISDEGAQAEVTVIPAGGDIQTNMQMWLGQIAIEPTDAAIDQALKSADPVEVNDQDAQVYWLNGTRTQEESDPQSILVADVPWRSGQSLFVKLKGDARLVEQQRDNFMGFVQSLSW